MQPFLIPACYFPTTALFVDDGHDFFLNFVLHLEEDLAYQIAESPTEVLEYIHKKHYEDSLRHQCLSEFTNAQNYPFSPHTINLDLAAIHAEVYNARRFSEASVIVVNDEMPTMTGLAFCQHINNSHIKKILLINPRNEAHAIQALEDGLIHCYIRKDDQYVGARIIKHIKALQLQYFQSMSEIMVRMLSINEPSCMHDIKFANFFETLCQEKNIVEYYLADNSGSFFMLDEDASVSFLIVKDEADMQLHYNLALENGVSKQELAALAAREKIPCLWQANNSEPHWNEWSNCLVQANQLKFDESYYYAFIKGPVIFDVYQDKILSYHRYLDELDTQALLVE